MLELFLPYVIGIALGITPGDDETVAQSDAPSTARAPEPQVATGKFTTAIEVKPILGMTKGNWVAVRLYDGQDLLYFTHLLSWRCGIWEVRYGVNGAAAETVLPMEPCYPDTATPNALADIENFLPYVTLPAESITSVAVTIDFDDGSSESATFTRDAVLIP